MKRLLTALAVLATCALCASVAYAVDGGVVAKEAILPKAAATPWLDTFKAIWIQVYPYLGSALGLMLMLLGKYPPGDEKAGKIRTILQFISDIVDWFSPLPRKGTDPHFKVGIGLNVPFKSSGKKPKAPPVALLVAGLGALLTLQGCCVFTAAGCKDGPGKCASDEVKNLGPSLLPLIVDIVAARGINADIEAELKAQGKAVATDVIVCLVKELFGQVDARITQVKSGGFATSPDSYLNVPLDRLQLVKDGLATWKTKHGVK